MILVVLGTQDKEFTRLLEAVDSAIKRGIIEERVVVQAGQTHYSSENMEIFDLLSAPQFEKLMDEADVVITHGGVGSILTAIKKGKKIIAAARLSKYKEHHNDHQKQVIGEFVKQGYLIELKDFYKIDKALERVKKFKPKKFVSNNKNFICKLEEYINNENHISWYNKFHTFFWIVLIFVIVFLIGVLFVF